MFCSILDEIHQRWNRLGARNLQSMRTHCAAVYVSLQLALTSKLLARETTDEIDICTFPFWEYSSVFGRFENMDSYSKSFADDFIQ